MIANVTRVSYKTRVKFSGIEDEVEMPHSELVLAGLRRPAVTEREDRNELEKLN